MFDGASNVQLFGELLKIHYSKITVMRGVEHTVSLFLNDVYKIPVVNQMISAHNACHNFQSPTIEHFGFNKNLPVAVLELFIARAT